MAMAKCKECGAEVSDSAKTCPKCGKKNPSNKTSLIVKLIAILFVLAVIGQVASKSGSDNNHTPTQATTPDIKPTSNWVYTQEKDDMSGKQISYASAKSTNKVDFKFPYNGGSQGTLDIRKHPRFGKDVIFSVDKGQILCNSYDGCSVSIKFDDKPPVKYHANSPADNSSTELFIKGYDGLVSKLKSSKQAIIEVEFFQSGENQYNFNTSGLKWD